MKILIFILGFTLLINVLVIFFLIIRARLNAKRNKKKFEQMKQRVTLKQLVDNTKSVEENIPEESQIVYSPSANLFTERTHEVFDVLRDK